MKRLFHTKTGKVTRELTAAEKTKLAALGDTEVLKDIAKKTIAAATTDKQKMDAIIKMLGLK